MWKTWLWLWGPDSSDNATWGYGQGPMSEDNSTQTQWWKFKWTPQNAKPPKDAPKEYPGPVIEVYKPDYGPGNFSWTAITENDTSYGPPAGVNSSEDLWKG